MFDLQANPNHPIYNALDRENTGIKMKVEKRKKYPVLKDVVLTTDGKWTSWRADPENNIHACAHTPKYCS